jgi:CHAT domain-containing protein
MMERGTQLQQECAQAKAWCLAYGRSGKILLVWLLIPGQAPILEEHAVDDSVLTHLAAAFRSEVAGPARIGQMGAGRPSTGSIAAGKRLATLLVPPAIATARLGQALVLVPHGPTAAIPFAALPLPDRDEYLGQRFAIRIVPALRFVTPTESQGQMSLSHRSRAGRLKSAIFGPPPQIPGIADLPNARNEAIDVAALLRGTPISGAGATIRELATRAEHADVIHLATHAFEGTGNDDSQTFVQLAPDSAEVLGTFIHSGRLDAAVILGPDFPSVNGVLVVLSACTTAGGTVTDSEGVLGLPRAFLGRGARAVLASLWRVEDKATRRFVARFYQHLTTDDDLPDEAEALRRTQLDFSTERSWWRFGGLRYQRRDWAAFQLIAAF